VFLLLLCFFNSFPEINGVPLPGNKFGSHFISAVTARVRRDTYEWSTLLNLIEIGAIYVGGICPTTKRSFHLQISMVSNLDPSKNQESVHRYTPDSVAFASEEQLLTSPDHIIFVYAVLGESDVDCNKFTKSKQYSEDITANCELLFRLNQKDLDLWDSMDKATFDIMENVFAPGQDKVEYWVPLTEEEKKTHRNSTGKWASRRPELDERRVPGMVHESSVTAMGKYPNQGNVVGLDFRPFGVSNVYVTGSGLWRTAASWNPTMTMCAFAQKLADERLKANEEGLREQ